MKIEDHEAFGELLRLFAAFQGTPPAEQGKEWSQVESYVTQLVDSGWTRKEIHELVSKTDTQHGPSMPEECSDALSNYLTGLVGQVADECIVRLPGEGGDVSEHARYLRALKWLE